MGLIEKIKQNAKTLKDWETECKQLVPWNALTIPDKSEKWVPYDTFHLVEMVPVDVVLKILSSYTIIEKQKLRELADLLKTRPKCWEEEKLIEWFRDFRKKFVELGLDTKKEK